MTEASDQQSPLSAGEQLDQDNMQADPLEGGAEPPERWSGADRHGMTQAEQAEGEPLDERLRQERPDVGAGDTGQPDQFGAGEPDQFDAGGAGPLGDDEVSQGREDEMPRMTDSPADNADRAGGGEDNPIRGLDSH
ncbi:hypothetical protein [Thermocrispum municipale]|uniref:hypothetical protein n=1 Tax=Thermocrispum municipale TaxID=37926 RepID=UPI000409DB5D|nr:hypothetical protein [Thermocrispum municipale]